MPTAKKSSSQAHGHPSGQDKKEKKAAMAHPHKEKEAAHQAEPSTNVPGAVSDTQQPTGAMSRAAQRKAKHGE